MGAQRCPPAPDAQPPGLVYSISPVGRGLPARLRRCPRAKAEVQSGAGCGLSLESPCRRLSGEAGGTGQKARAGVEEEAS